MALFAATSTGRAQSTNSFAGTNYVEFLQPTYSVREDGLMVTIAVRAYSDPVALADTNNLVFFPFYGAVDYSTSDGSARAGVDYYATSGKLNFFFGNWGGGFGTNVTEVLSSFDVFIKNDAFTNGNRTVVLSLNNLDELSFGPNQRAILTITDDELLPKGSSAGILQFNYASYEVTGLEGDVQADISPMGARITVTRTSGSDGRIMVDYSTVAIPGGAVVGQNYGATAGTLVFDDFQTSASFIVPIPRQKSDFTYFTTNIVNGRFPFQVKLSNPRADSREDAALIRPSLGGRSVATVTVNRLEGGFGIIRSHWVFTENQGVRTPVRNADYVGPLWEQGFATIVVKRSGPIDQGVSCHYWTNVKDSLGDEANNIFPTDASNEYATPFSDFYPPATGAWAIALGGDPQNKLEWAAFDDSDRVIRIPIINDDLVEFPEDILVRLYILEDDAFPDGAQMGPSRSAHLSIAMDTIDGSRINNGHLEIGEQAAGSVDRTFNQQNRPDTVPPNNSQPGANNTVFAVVAQPDGRSIIGGDFSSYNATPRGRVARVLLNGNLDTTFNPGTGANGSVSALALYPPNSAFAGRVLVAGGFDSFNGTLRRGIARLMPDGSLDPSFNPGLGANDAVHAVAITETDTIYIGGDFTTVNGTNRNSFARLGRDGLLDTTFRMGAGFDGPVYAIGLVSGDARPVVGGDYTSYNGTGRNGVARLNADGSLDATFNPGTGVNGPVYSVARWGTATYIGGSFTQVNAVDRSSIAKLEQDGSIATAFYPGTGFDNTVYSIVMQPDGKPLIGGIFRSYNSTRRVGMARLFPDGMLDTSFMDTAYNHFAGIPNALSPNNPLSQENFVRSMAYWNTNYSATLTNVIDIAGSAAKIVTPVVNNYNFEYVYVGGRFKSMGGGYTLDDVQNQSNFARVIGGATAGPGNIGFTATQYYADEDAMLKYITVTRSNGNLASAGAAVVTETRPSGPGAAAASDDFSTVTITPTWVSLWDVARMKSEALTGPSNTDGDKANDLLIPIQEDILQEGDESLNMRFFLPKADLVLGGVPIPVGAALGIERATLTIIDNDFNFGTLAFSSSDYTVNEDGKYAVLTVVREGGLSGSLTVDYATVDGTALQGRLPDYDYERVTGTLTFREGQATNIIKVRIWDDTKAELDEAFSVLLYNPTGYPEDVAEADRIDPARANSRVTIVDNDFAPGRVLFSEVLFIANESDSTAIVTVKRSGGNLGDVFVDYSTEDGTAINGVNYDSITGTLHWANGDILPKTLRIKLRANDVIDPDRTFRLTLSNPKINGLPNYDLLGNIPTTTVRLINDDAVGSYTFSQSQYAVDENAGFVDITVLRQFGQAGQSSVRFTVSGGTAVAGKDFVSTEGTLVFGSGEISKSFRITTLDNAKVDGDRMIALRLQSATEGATISNANSVLSIIDNEQVREPAGSLDTTFIAEGTDDFIYTMLLQPDNDILIAGNFRFFNNIVRNGLARLNPDGAIDSGFNPGQGASGSVRTLTREASGRLLIGGLFTNYNNVVRNFIARLNLDGTLDESFNPGAGTDNPVYSIVVQADQKVLLGGDFASFNGVNQSSLVRLQTNGVIDASFDIGTGANGTVYALALQSDGKILVGGDFTTFNTKPSPRFVRLNANGSIDSSFKVAQGFDSSVRSIVVQSDGKILVGGLFNQYGVTEAHGILRLNPDGSLDSSFETGRGADGPVNGIAVQIDGRIIAVGDFTLFSGVIRNRIVRLSANGHLDPTVNYGTGANASISAIVLQPDRKAVVVGGFTQFNTQPAAHIARLYGGSMAGPGKVQFAQANYRVSETVTNAEVMVMRTGGTTGAFNVSYSTQPVSATVGVDYQEVSGVLAFAEAETMKVFIIPLANDYLVEGDEQVLLTLRDPVAPGSTTAGQLGEQPTATLTIESDDSTISFSQIDYSVNEQSALGGAVITITRQGSTFEPLSVDYFTTDGPTNGAPARAGVDYTATKGTLYFAVGETSKMFLIPVADDLLVEGIEKVSLTLTNLITARTNASVLFDKKASLAIIDNDFAPGELNFAATDFSINESGGFGVITVRRTAGSGGVVSVSYATQPGTATPGSANDYDNVNGIISFVDGESSKSFRIPIHNDFLVEGNETVIVTISNPQGGVVLAGNVNQLISVLTVVDDDFGPGSLDKDFDPGAGANGTVRALTRLANGNLLLGGDFTTYDRTNRSRIARILPTGKLDLGFVAGSSATPGVGPNGLVAAIALQRDGQILISGGFSSVAGLLNNRMARLSDQGLLDGGFKLPLGFNGEVSSIAVSDAGKVLIGGKFSIASAAGFQHVAMLNANGTVDLGFSPGLGADGDVNAVALQRNGKALLGGSFNRFDGAPRAGLVRLNEDGSIDLTFNMGTGLNGAVNDIQVLDDGRILLVGDFTAYNGKLRTRVARLNSDGSLDISFNKEGGPNAVVYALDVQTDGKVLVVGDFTMVSGQSRNRLARLNEDGSIDKEFLPGDGADAAVYAVSYDPATSRVTIGGAFKTVDHQPRNGIARFNGDKRVMPVVEIILFVVKDPNGALRFTFSSQEGVSYVLEASSTLSGFTEVQSVTAISTTTEITDNPGDSRAKFYRVRRTSP